MVTMSGSSRYSPVAPSRPTTCVCVSSTASSVPCRASSLAQLLVPAAVRPQQMQSVGHRGLRQDEGDIAGRQRLLEHRRVVELRNPDAPGHAPRQAALHWPHRPVVEVDQALLEVAVIVAVEQQYDLPAGRRASQPDRLGVRLGRGQRELPVAHRIAPRQLLGDLDRRLGRQQELGRPGGLVGDRADDRRVGMAAEHRHVGGVEVDVVEAVDVGESGAGAVRDVDGLVVVRRHPGAGDAVGHVRAGPLQRRQRARPVGPEPGELLLVQGADTSAVEVAVRRHRADHTETSGVDGHQQLDPVAALVELDERPPWVDVWRRLHTLEGRARSACRPPAARRSARRAGSGRRGSSLPGPPVPQGRRRQPS